MSATDPSQSSNLGGRGACEPDLAWEPVEFAKAEDRRIFVRVERSGGGPGIDRLVVRPGTPSDSSPHETRPPGVAQSPVVLIDEAPAVNYDFTVRAVVSVLASWLVHRVIFRGGWTVHVDAPDHDPIKIRCTGREEAKVLARTLAADLKDRGLAALHEL